MEALDRTRLSPTNPSSATDDCQCPHERSGSAWKGRLHRFLIVRTIATASILLRSIWSERLFPDSILTSQDSRIVWSSRRQWVMGGLLAVVTFIPLTANIGYPLIEPDEARYAQIALEMYQSGNWIVPTLQGEPYLDKPPLLYWSTAACYSLFGPSEWSARLPVALAAWLTILCTYVLSIRLIGDRAAWMASIALLISAGFVVCGRFLIMDGMLTLMTTATTLATARGLFDTAGRIRWWIVAGAMFGLGIMVKGPVGILLCAPPVAMVYFLSTKKLNFGLRSLIAMIVPCAIIVAPWFYLVALQQEEFFAYFLWKHHVLRFVNSFIHQEPWWYFAPVLALGMFPVSLLFPALVADIVRNRHGKLRRTAEYGFVTLTGVWIVFFFSLSSCKLPTYILPAIPLLCISIGVMLEESVVLISLSSFIKRYTQRASQAACIIVTLLGAMAIGADAWFVRYMTIPSALMTLSVLALVVAWFRFIRFGSYWQQSPWNLLVMICVVVGPFGFTHVLPHFAAWRSNLQHAILYQRSLGNQVPIVFLGEPSDSAGLEISKDRFQHLKVRDTAAIESILEKSDPVILVTNHFGLYALNLNFPGRYTIQAENARRRTYLVRRVDSTTEQSVLHSSNEATNSSRR